MVRPHAGRGTPHHIMENLPIIYAYTRSQAVADGVQVEVSKTAAEAGIRFPVFLTRGVFDAFVTVPPGAVWRCTW